MLKKRIVTSIWGIALVVVLTWFGNFQPLFTIFVAVWGFLAVTEFYRLAAATGAAPQIVLGTIWTLLFIGSRSPSLPGLINPHFDLNLLIPGMVTLGIIISLISLLARKQKTGAFSGWVWTLAGVVYVGWLLGYMVQLRGIDDGRNWLFLAFFCTFASDTTAYFVGSAIGKHKLAPSISPGKTWEGSIAGAIGAIIVALLFILPTPFQISPELNWWRAVILGLLVSVFGQFGDMVESLIKRNTGAKDSGTLLAGHGGVLDRTDSVIFAIVIVYYWAICIK